MAIPKTFLSDSLSVLVTTQPLGVPAMKAPSVHRAWSSDQKVILKKVKDISAWIFVPQLLFCLDKVPCVEEGKTAEAMTLDWSISKTFPTVSPKILLEKLIQKNLDKRTVMGDECKLKDHKGRVLINSSLAGWHEVPSKSSDRFCVASRLH